MKLLDNFDWVAIGIAAAGAIILIIFIVGSY